MHDLLAGLLFVDVLSKDITVCRKIYISHLLFYGGLFSPIFRWYFGRFFPFLSRLDRTLVASCFVEELIHQERWEQLFFALFHIFTILFQAYVLFFSLL